MRKSFIALVIISFLAAPSFAAGIPPKKGLSAKQPPKVEKRLHKTMHVPPAKRHFSHAPVIGTSMIVVDYNCAGAPVKVTRFGCANYFYNRFYL